MSAQATAWVWTRAPADLRTEEVLVLLVLADAADGAGVAALSVAFIAQRARLTRAWAEHVLGLLRERGIIRPVAHPLRHQEGVETYQFTALGAS